MLYEIWSLGEKPFKELTNPEVSNIIMSLLDVFHAHTLT